MSKAPARQPQFLQLHRPDAQVLRAELAAGLQSQRPHISPKYLYDALGSRLFEAITELPEYYPTRTEAALLAQHAPAIAAALPQHATLVDLGAGNCEKAARLFEHLQPSRYVAVDISVDFLRNALQTLQRQHPQLEMLGVGMDFSHTLSLPTEAGFDQRVLFYPGSSIGNFTRAEAVRFLAQTRAAAQGGGLLIGVDLVKPLAVLEPAYSDALGITAAFNKNMLLHINRLIGSDFSVRDWAHKAFFNPQFSRIEMHLQAEWDVIVSWPGVQREFLRGERIHTENSYKYTVANFENLLQLAGFTQTQVWQDDQQWFAMFWAQA